MPIPGLSQAAVSYIKKNYKQRELLEECVAFVGCNIEDAPPPSSDVLVKRVGFFPWTETSRDLDQALNLAIISFYKASWDHLRRALELIVVGAFFSSSVSKEEDARDWLQSDHKTPFFSRALSTLCKLPKYQDFDSAINWTSKLKELYWQLSDIVHVRGIEASFDKIQPSNLHLGDKFVPRYDAKCLNRVLDYYIFTVRHCATVVAISNPVLLVGLPIDEKFGFNPPVSGFFNVGQAEMLFNLVLPETGAFFRDLIKNDQGVQSIVDWVRNKPDLTEEDLKRQSSSMDEMLGV